MDTVYFVTTYTTKERSFGTGISANRGRKAELSLEQRSAIIHAHELGRSPSKLVQEFGCARGTIYDTLNRFQQHRATQSLPRSGRAKSMSPRATHEVHRLARRNPKWSYLILRSQLSDPPSKTTIRRILDTYGLRRRRARRKTRFIDPGHVRDISYLSHDPLEALVFSLSSVLLLPVSIETPRPRNTSGATPCVRAVYLWQVWCDRPNRNALVIFWFAKLPLALEHGYGPTVRDCQSLLGCT